MLAENADIFSIWFVTIDNAPNTWKKAIQAWVMVPKSISLAKYNGATKIYTGNLIKFEYIN